MGVRTQQFETCLGCLCGRFTCWSWDISQRFGIQLWCSPEMGELISGLDAIVAFSHTTWKHREMSLDTAPSYCIFFGQWGRVVEPLLKSESIAVCVFSIPGWSRWTCMVMEFSHTLIKVCEYGKLQISSAPAGAIKNEYIHHSLPFTLKPVYTHRQALLCIVEPYRHIPSRNFPTAILKPDNVPPNNFQLPC